MEGREKRIITTNSNHPPGFSLFLFLLTLRSCSSLAFSKSSFQELPVSSIMSNSFISFMWTLYRRNISSSSSNFTSRIISFTPEESYEMGKVWVEREKIELFE